MSKWKVLKDQFGNPILGDGKKIIIVDTATFEIVTYGITIDRAEQIVKEHNGYEEMREACESAKLFIKYARYELRVGRATIGCQFPCKEDADIEIKKLEQALKETQ